MRDDNAFAEPFLANKSSIHDQASEPKDNPQGDLRPSDDISPFDKIPRAFIETKCDAGKNLRSETPGRRLNNFGRLRQLYSDHAQRSEYIYWYCYDYGSTCTEGVQAYSWDSNGWFWSNHYTVFCDPFYGQPTLDDAIKKNKNNIHEQKIMENFQTNRGQIMFHETWHYKNRVSSPRTGDYAYRAQKAWELARDSGTNYAYVNADSYTLDAVAIYVQQYYKSSMSPVPWKELGGIDEEAGAATTEPTVDNAKAVTLKDTPKDWKGPLPYLFNPDLTVWEEVNDNKELSTPPDEASGDKSELHCQGVGTTKWMGRDALNDAIGEFCDDAEKQGVQDKDSASLVRNYNDNGPDAITLSIDWPTGSPFKPKKDTCVGYLTTVMDSCDGNDPDHNPLNWKHGGNTQVGDVRYNIIPTTERYKAGVCSMHVKEKQEYSGIDGPGTKRSHTFHVQLNAKDADGATVGGINGDWVEAGKDGGNPYTYDRSYNTLIITREARGDYVQFSIGDQSWTTSDANGVPRCQTGGWDATFYEPEYRDMDCFFKC
ncbi:MAG: hypothetical protein LQ338_007981 [Usnochroma carphineum]|nr:MAG: hypothetical protein LQ338_007981 [Usnochroma carphineum]